MLKNFNLAIAFLALTGLVFFAAGCSSATPAAPALPTRVSVAPTVVETAPRTSVSASPTAAAPMPTQAANSSQSAPAGYAGDWNGTTSSADTPISFTVENNQVTFVNLSYSVRSGDCSLSGSLSKTVNATINGKAFTMQITDDDGKQYIFAGTFTSNTQASGTLQVKGTSQTCGAFDAKATWNAQVGAASSDASADSTPDTSAMPASANMSDSDVLLVFFQAINRKDVDAALALTDDQVVFNIASTPGIGKDALKVYLQKQISHNVTYTVSNLKSMDLVLSFTLQASDTGSRVDGDMASVDSGLIQTLTLH